MIRKYDWRKPKGNRYYTKKTLAALYGVHPATVSAWIHRHGLSVAVVDDRRPLIMKGQLIREWMKQWQDDRGWGKCADDELSCLSCNAGRNPQVGSFWIEFTNTEKIYLHGLCNGCGNPLRCVHSKCNVEDIRRRFSRFWRED